jgi:type IV secretory pathway TrbD component
MSKEEPQGFRIAIHRSLTEPIMMGGVPRSIALANGIAVVSFVLGAHNLWILPIGIITHLILVALHRRDKAILSILKRNLSKPPFLRA